MKHIVYLYATIVFQLTLLSKNAAADDICKAGCEISYKSCQRGAAGDIDKLLDCQDQKSECMSGCSFISCRDTFQACFSECFNSSGLDREACKETCRKNYQACRR